MATPALHRDPAASPGRTRRFRLRLPRARWLFLLIPLIPLLLLGGGLLYAWRTFDGIGRVELTGVLDRSDGQGVNLLLAGSDSREHLDPDVAGEVGAPSVSGQRADSIIVLRSEGGTTRMMSIPRDLYVTVAETGRHQKINAAYNGGPARLVKTVQTELGIPIHHYAEVDFETFGSLVDAVGGVDIDFPKAAYDRNSGLELHGPGREHLDGQQALAYVRSRHYVEVVDGSEREDPRADLGRQERQQAFLRAVMGKVGGVRNPITAVKVARGLGDGLTVDDDLGMWESVSIARALGSGDPTTEVLPTSPDRVGGADVLRLADGAEEVLSRFR